MRQREAHLRELSTPHRRGVTLIEIVLATVLMTASAAVGVFYLRPDFTGRHAVVSAVETVNASFQTARQAAIDLGSPVEVRLQRRDTDSDGVADQDFVLVECLAGPFGDSREWSFPVHRLVRVTGSPRPFRFAADGAADHAAMWNLTGPGSAGQSDRGWVRVERSDGVITTSQP